MIRRLHVGAAVILGSVLVLTACGSSDSATNSEVQGEKFRIGLSWTPNVSNSPPILADEEGFFADNGLDVDIIPSGPNAPTGLELIAAGGAEMALADNVRQVLKANADGGDYVIVGAGAQRNLYSFISRADDPVNSIADLKGKTIGVPTGSQVETIPKIAEANGVKPDELGKIIVAGADAGGLIDGVFDVYAPGLATNHPVYLKQRGLETHTLSFEDVGMPEYGEVFVVDRKYLQTHREQVVAALAAILKGYQVNVDDPAAGAQVVMDKYGVDLGYELANLTASNTLLADGRQSDDTATHGLMWVNADRVAGPMWEGFRFWDDLDQTGSSEQVKDAIDMSPLEEAHAVVG